MVLLRIRGETIKFASFQKRKKSEQENRLVKEIANLESKLGHDNLVIMEEKKVELEKLRERSIQGNIIRSRPQWLIEGEKPKYFCSLEKYNYVENTIKCIQIDSGQKYLTKKKF